MKKTFLRKYNDYPILILTRSLLKVILSTLVLSRNIFCIEAHIQKLNSQQPTFHRQSFSCNIRHSHSRAYFSRRVQKVDVNLVAARNLHLNGSQSFCMQRSCLDFFSFLISFASIHLNRDIITIFHRAVYPLYFIIATELVAL